MKIKRSRAFGFIVISCAIFARRKWGLKKFRRNTRTPNRRYRSKQKCRCADAPTRDFLNSPPNFIFSASRFTCFRRNGTHSIPHTVRPKLWATRTRGAFLLPWCVAWCMACAVYDVTCCRSPGVPRTWHGNWRSAPFTCRQIVLINRVP